MARNATPLLRALPLPELHGGVELLIVESLLAHPDSSAASGYEEEHSLCVLMLVSPTETERRWLRIEAQRYVGARASVVPVTGTDWAAGVGQVLSDYGAAFLDVVVGLPDHETAIERSLLEVRRRLKAGHHQLSTVVAVAGEPSAWQALDRWMGMVVAPGLSAAQGATWLHAGLAQLSAAPGLVECLSGADLEACWGTASQPTRLTVVGQERFCCWTRGQGAVYVGGRVAVFCLANAGLARYRAIASDLKAAGHASPLIVAPTGLTVCALGSAPDYFVLLVPALHNAHLAK